MKKESNRRKNKLLNLKYDVSFKAYFKRNENVLKSALQAYLPLPENRTIKSVRVLDPSIHSPGPKDKESFFDLKVELDTGERVNVEMQLLPQKSFLKRVLFYWSRLYSHSVRRGDGYETIHPAYSLVFTDFSLFPRQEGFYHSFSIRLDDPPYFSLSGDLRMVFVELNRFNKGSVLELVDMREKWSYLLRESGRMSFEEARRLLESWRGEMSEAVNHFIELSRDETLREIEEVRQKRIMDKKAREAYVFDRGFNRGLKEGQEKGMKEGMEKGKQEGIQKGIHKTVSMMLKEKVDISFISRMTGLSEEKIQKIGSENS